MLAERLTPTPDIHPDPFYKVHSSTDVDHACHRGTGPAGVYGAETTPCDAPLSLLNATFDWIDANLKDEVDFVIWTGDSARHDNDDDHPRTPKQVAELNEAVVHKFLKVWGNKDGELKIPIVPTFGNNDILPHNIFLEGPNTWTRRYLDIWRHFIPEEQRHQFQQGGWFHVEVVPGRLAVISMNTMYFYTKNAAVDGCAPKSEPGYEHFEWLRVQLEMFRQRGMKVLLMGHVPPARTESKISWDETCWQKYALWLEQYRDVIAGSLYGHMNIEHFMLQDFKDIKKSTRGGSMKAIMTPAEDGIDAQSDTSYLIDLRDIFSGLATFSKSGKDAKNLKKIGGKYGERYAVSHVSQSVVPNYFPTLRVFEYNISGLEHHSFAPSRDQAWRLPEQSALVDEDFQKYEYSVEVAMERRANRPEIDMRRKKYKFHLPSPPSKSTPPGPAYSPQTFSLKGYHQFYANLTYINNDFTGLSAKNVFIRDLPASEDDKLDLNKWNPGKHHGKKPKKDKPDPNEFEFLTEYDTAKDKIYKLEDLSVRSYLSLAARIGKKASKLDGESEAPDEELDVDEDSDDQENAEDEISIFGKGRGKKKHHKKKHHKSKKTNKVWYAFLQRAFAGALDPEDIEERFGEIAPEGLGDVLQHDPPRIGQAVLNGA